MRAGLAAFAIMVLQGSFERGREVDASPQVFRYQRVVRLPSNAVGQACAVLDAAVFEHSEGRTAALRVYELRNIEMHAVEVPFALTESGEAGQETETAHAINVGRKGSAIAFDLEMPRRSYTAVELGLSGHDFYATARVSGSDGRGGPATELGTFALFDLAGRGLSRSTTLPLQETSFARLHVELTMTSAPGGDAKALGPEMVGDAKVPPSREAQTLYTAVAQTSARTADERVPHVDHFQMNVAAHVPVERVTIALKHDFARNFLRNVSLSEKAAKKEDADAGLTPLGQIMRVHLPGVGGGAPIREETLSLPVASAANLRGGAIFDVSVDNGDDAPLPIEQVTLEMRQRKVCFEAETGAAYVLRYGSDDDVRAPVYDYARLFRANADAAQVALEPETPNPVYHAEMRHSSFLERHPELIWVALVAVIAVLGTVALHSAKRAGIHGQGPND